MENSPLKISMEEKLLREASKWTLQQDDEVRLLLENFKNGVSNTGARLNSNIEQLKEKILSTDCDIQQLNTQLALLKNVKFVENTVEEEDSRPKPIPPTVVFSKDEMVRIVVDSVKSTLKDVTTQLNWERDPIGIEALPSFNDEAFSSYILGPSRPPSQEPTRMGPDAVTTPEGPTIPKMVPLAPSFLIPVQNGLRNYSSGESEPEVQISRVQKTPEPPSMEGFKQPTPIIEKSPKPQTRGLFSSDDEDEDEEEPLLTTPVQPTVPIVKPSQNLMQQLTSKLKSRETGVTEEAKAVGSEVDERKITPISVKEEEPKPVTAQRRTVAPAATEAPSSSETTSSIIVTKQGKKEELPVQQKRVPDPFAPKTTVSRKEPMKKRGLFSDSDSSEEEFVAPVKPAVVKPVVKPVQEQKKEETVKTLAGKTTSTVRKSIFDSDSSDDEFTGFFKKSSTVEKKATASSSLLQKRPLSPVKVASQTEWLKKTASVVTEKKSAFSSASPLKHETPSSVVLVKSQNQPIYIDPLAAEEEFFVPTASSSFPVPVSSKPTTVPAKTTEPIVSPKQVFPKPAQSVSVERTEEPVKVKAAAKSESPIEVQSPTTPVCVERTEEPKKVESPVRVESPPAVLPVSSPVSVKKTKEFVEVQQPVTPPKVRSPSPLEEPPKFVPKAKSLTFESRSLSADVPPIPETRSDSPPEEVSDHLEQDSLPPLPTADPLTDSPLEEEMPVGKAPGKLNNANFAAMLGRQLSAGPPGSRPKPASTLSTDHPEHVSFSSPASVSASPTTDSPGGLCHLTKSRPRRPNVHKPSVAKVEDVKAAADPLASATNGVSDSKISLPSTTSKQAPIPKSPEKARPVTKTPIAEKKPEPTKALNGSLNVSAPKAEVKPAVRVTASVKSATTTSTTIPKKGLFDFSSSDDEPSSSSKITKAAATLKTSVTSGSPSLTLKPKSTPLPGTAASKSMPRNANLAKYKNMFDQEDDLDVSLFKKDKA